MFISWVKDEFHQLDPLRKTLLFGTYGFITVQFILAFIPDNKCLTRKLLLGNASNSDKNQLVYTTGTGEGSEDTQIEETLQKSGNSVEISENTRLIANGERDKRPCTELLCPYIVRITFMWLPRFLFTNYGYIVK